jgi:hypothetical protein
MQASLNNYIYEVTYPTEQLIAYQLKMLKYNTLTPLIKVESLVLENETKLLWKIEGLCSLSKVLRGEGLIRIKDFFESLYQCFSVVDSFLLDPKGISLDLNHCFEDNKGNYYFMYTPKDIEVTVSLESNMEYLMNQLQSILDDEDEESMVKLHQLRLIIKDERATLLEVYDVLNGKRFEAAL